MTGRARVNRVRYVDPSRCHPTGMWPGCGGPNVSGTGMGRIGNLICPKCGEPALYLSADRMGDALLCAPCRPEKEAAR